MGLVYIGPMLHINYSKVLPALVPDKGSASSVALKKLMFDQLCFAPICMSGFFILINCIEGKGAQSGIRDLKNKF